MAFDILGKACNVHCCCQFMLVQGRNTGRIVPVKDPMTGKEMECAFWQFAVTAPEGSIKIRADGKDTLAKNLIFRARMVDGGWVVSHQLCELPWSATKASGD